MRHPAAVYPDLRDGREGDRARVHITAGGRRGCSIWQKSLSVFIWGVRLPMDSL